MNENNIKRKCIVTNKIIDINQLLRFNFDKKNNIITLDINKIKKGRGAYFLPTKENWEIIKNRKGLNRAFRTPVNKEVYIKIDKELEDFLWTKKID